MNIKIETLVKGNYKEVLARFDRDLFEKLSPPGASVEIVQFDGSHKGDTVHIRLTLAGLVKQDWISKIVEEKTDDKVAMFVDQGVKLPFFLSKWTHRHIVENVENDHSRIIDDIEFEWNNVVFTAALYPALYAQFAYRRPIYRDFFGKPSRTFS